MFIEINKPLQMLMLTPWRYGLKKHQNLTRIIRIWHAKRMKKLLFSEN
ncbi:Uncharacterised protein [Streptococcus pyogenes]|nr:Uncharacterised protein [Streptococcus pyogenes]